MPENLKSYLAQRSIPDDEIAYLLSRMLPMELKAGQDFVTEGGAPEYVGFIESGLLKACYVSNEGKEFLRGFYAEGETVAPYSSLIQKIPSSITIRAIEPTKLKVLRGDDYLGLFNRHVSWERFGRHLVETYMIMRERREKSFLIDDAAARYEFFLQEFGEISSRIKDKDIAAYIGITPEALSRMRGKRNRLKS